MMRSALHQRVILDVQLHIGDAPLRAGPESILPIVVIDSGLAPSGAPRNDGRISIRDMSENGQRTTRLAQVICPSGVLLTGVSSLISDFPKNISVPTHPKSHLELCASHPTRGAYRDRHGRGMGCGGRGSVGARWGRRAGLKACERQLSEQTNDADAYGKIVWS